MKFDKLDLPDPKVKTNTCKSCPWYSYRGFGRGLNMDDTLGTCVVSGKYVFPDTLECYYRQVEKKKEIELFAYKELEVLYRKMVKKSEDDYKILRFYYDKIYLKLQSLIDIKEFLDGIRKEFDEYCKTWGITILKEEKKNDSGT